MAVLLTAVSPRGRTGENDDRGVKGCPFFFLPAPAVMINPVDLVSRQRQYLDRSHMSKRVAGWFGGSVEEKKPMRT